MKKITINQNNIFSDSIGLNGIEAQSFFAWEQKTKEILDLIQKEIKNNIISWPSLPFQDEEIKSIVKFAKEERKKWDTILLLGIGGSSLGAIALEQSLRKDKKPNLIVLDNIDPDFFTEKLVAVNWRKTLVLVISKSGQTPETMAQFLIIQDILKHEVKNNYQNQIVVITDNNNGELKKIADNEGYHQFYIPENLGGRFSVLSPVGLLPAALIGIDIIKICAGAKEMENDCFKEDFTQNPAALLAVAVYLLDKKKQKIINISFPYCNRLLSLADWYRQLLAESIGKNEKTGLTPEIALGSTDQHSQLQLWNEGPNNKVITFWEVQKFKNTIPIPDIQNNKIGYLGKKTLNQLISAEKSATVLSLTKHRRPNQTILIPSVNEETIGQLIFLLETQVAILGKLYNIDTYNQPGVEEGKELTKRILSNL